MKDGFKFWGSATLGSKGQIVIPVEAREALDLKEGDKILVMSGPDKRGAVLMKAESFEAMMVHMQSKLGIALESAKKLKDKE